MRTITLVFLLGLLGCSGAPSPQSAPYSPQPGDIVFHTSRSSQSVAVQSVTGSAYSHMGLVLLRDGQPEVLEAVQPVKRTPLDQWIARGEGGHFVVRRLADAPTLLTEQALARMEALAGEFTGRSYDPYFGWTDERIYCSELVYKIYQRGLGLEIGTLERFRDFNLTDPVVAPWIQRRFGGSPPLDEPVVSPASIFESPLLVTVYSR